MFFGVIVAVAGVMIYFLQPQEQEVRIESQDGRNVTMRTVIGQDDIPAIDNPIFLTTESANREYRDNELVIGVEIDGDARAYSVPYLSRHEIVNDTVGGRPISVTW